MFYSAVPQVEGYWRALYDIEGRIPARASLDPRGMANVLEYAMLLERIAPGIARIRLAGSHMTDLLGMEVRGMPLTAFFVPDTRDAIKKAVENVCENQRIVDIDLKSSAGPLRQQLEGRLFMAPLVDEAGKVTRILAALQTSGTIGHTPRRFDKVTPSARSLNAARNYERPVEPAREYGFSEAQAPFTPAGKPETGRPHLRLVYSAD